MLFKKKPRADPTLRAWATIMFIVMVATNILANVIPINDITTAQVSDSYPNLFAPSGFTFAIWGLIYIGLVAYTLYQSGYFQKKKPGLDEGDINKISRYFLISSVLNTLWIFSWHYKIIWLSTLLIIGILLCLIRIAGVFRLKQLNQREYWLVRLPFSIYFGWISIAVIANITTWLVSVNWDGWGRTEEFWTITILTIGAIIGLIRTRYDQDIAYGLVFVWAYIGILAKHLSESGWDGQYPGVIGAAASLLAVLTLEIVIITRRALRHTL